MRAAAIFALLVFAPALARADEPASQPADTAPVVSGKPAPFSGVLVREKRFVKMLDAELQVPALQGKLALEQRFSAGLEDMYKARLKDAVAPEPFYKTQTFAYIVGFVGGALITAGAIYGGAKILELARAR